MAVRIEQEGPVTTIILDNPKVRNAVDPDTAEDLAAAFRDFERDDSASVAVLWGDHGCFCAGYDLKAFAAQVSAGLSLDFSGIGPMGPSRMMMSKPTIAAVAGHAVAGGLELAVLCDLRVLEESAVMGVFCRRWGVPLIDGGTVRLPRLIGLGRALDLILTGRPVGATEALAMGLANRVVPDGTSRQAAEALAHEIAAFPQITLRKDRQSAYEQASLHFEAALKNEYRHGLAALASGEAEIGARRFTAGAGRHGAFDPPIAPTNLGTA